MHKPAMSVITADQASPVLKLDEFLPHRLNLCSGNVSAALSSIYAERYQIGVPEWRVIVILGEFGRLTAKEIGVHGQMHKTKVSRAVAVLEKRQYVTRRTNVADLREAFLSLTPDGRAVYDDVAPQAVEFVNRLMATIDPSDREAFSRVVRQLTERAGAMAAMTNNVTNNAAGDIAKGGKAG
jgi:DNA-binding MarR family transcriptional regulator